MTRPPTARQIAQEALASYPIRVRRVRLLHDGYNVTYRVDDEAGARYALRVSRPGPTPREVRDEVAWCEALARDTDVRLLRIVRARDGEPVAVAYGRCCVLSTWVEGAQRGEGLTPNMLRAVGRTMARMHRHGREWEPPAGWRRPRFDTVWPDDSTVLEQLPLDSAEAFAAAYARLTPLLAELLEDRAHVIHGDLHQGNYRFAPGHDVGVIDFDDCALGHPAQDIAISWYYLARFARYPSLCDAFKAGYTELEPWPLSPDVLEALLVWRGLVLCDSVLAHPSEKLNALGHQLLPRWTARCRRWLEGSA